MKTLLTMSTGMALAMLMFSQFRTMKEPIISSGIQHMEPKITYLEYHHSGMRYFKDYKLEWEEELKQYKVTYDSGESKTVYCDASIGEEIQKCLQEGKVDKYKKEYGPSKWMRKRIKDGDQWRFKVVYANGKTITSNGWIKKPKDFSGVMRTEEIIKKAVAMNLSE